MRRIPWLVRTTLTEPVPTRRRNAAGAKSQRARAVRLAAGLSLGLGAVAAGGVATAYCSAGGVVPQAVCSRVPERVPQCWVDTYRKIVTCEYILTGG